MPRPVDAWRDLGASSAVLGTVATAGSATFARTLPSRWQLPTMVGRLGHEVRPDAPGGQLSAMAAPLAAVDATSGDATPSGAAGLLWRTAVAPLGGPAGEWPSGAPDARPVARSAESPGDGGARPSSRMVERLLGGGWLPGRRDAGSSGRSAEGIPGGGDTGPTGRAIGGAWLPGDRDARPSGRTAERLLGDDGGLVTTPQAGSADVPRAGEPSPLLLAPLLGRGYDARVARAAADLTAVPAVLRGLGTPDAAPPSAPRTGPQPGEGEATAGHAGISLLSAVLGAPDPQPVADPALTGGTAPTGVSASAVGMAPTVGMVPTVGAPSTDGVAPTEGAASTGLSAAAAAAAGRLPEVPASLFGPSASGPASLGRGVVRRRSRLGPPLAGPTAPQPANAIDPPPPWPIAAPTTDGTSDRTSSTGVPSLGEAASDEWNVRTAVSADPDDSPRGQGVQPSTADQAIRRVRRTVPPDRTGGGAVAALPAPTPVPPGASPVPAAPTASPVAPEAPAPSFAPEPPARPVAVRPVAASVLPITRLLPNLGESVSRPPSLPSTEPAAPGSGHGPQRPSAVAPLVSLRPILPTASTVRPAPASPIAPLDAAAPPDAAEPGEPADPTESSFAPAPAGWAPALPVAPTAALPLARPFAVLAAASPPPTASPRPAPPSLPAPPLDATADARSAVTSAAGHPPSAAPVRTTPTAHQAVGPPAPAPPAPVPQPVRAPLVVPVRSDEAELDRLAARLHARLAGHLAADLLVGRERAHLLTDLY